MSSSKQPLLIIVGYVWPEPNSSAAGYRMLSLIQLFIAKGWQVIFASAAELSPHRFMLSTIGVGEHLISLNDSSFDEWISEQAPDAVMFDRFMLEEQFGWRVKLLFRRDFLYLETIIPASCYLASVCTGRQYMPFSFCVFLRAQLIKRPDNAGLLS